MSRVLGGSSHRALVVAFDHALVLGPIPGTEDPLGQIRRFAEGKADAVLLNLGLMRQFADSAFEAPPPALIARIDWTTVWSAISNNGFGDLRSTLLARPEDALRQGADAVVTYLVVGTGDTDFESREIERNAEVARQCERVGIPLIIESLARGPTVDNPGDVKWLNLHTRIATELGADAVKTDYAGNPASMRSVVEGCPIPILVLGGSRQGTDEEALDVVRGATLAGAAGVFFGRNVFQAADMQSFLLQARAVLDGTEILSHSNWLRICVATGSRKRWQATRLADHAKPSLRSLHGAVARSQPRNWFRQRVQSAAAFARDLRIPARRLPLGSAIGKNITIEPLRHGKARRFVVAWNSAPPRLRSRDGKR